MVGKVGNQPFAPVPLAEVHQDAVSPPAVGNLVGQTGSGNERQTDDRAPQQGKGGKAVTGREKVLHHGKLGEWIGTKQIAKEFDRVGGRLQVAVGQVGIFRVEVGADQQTVEPALLDQVRA